VYKESDIKWEGKRFSVIFNAHLKRFEVLKSCITHAEVQGWGQDEAAVIRCAQRLDKYAKPFPL
jgi:hypothetical protein